MLRSLVGSEMCIRDRLDGYNIIGPTDEEARGGVISFTHNKIHPHDIGEILDKFGIAIRTGHHCAMPLVRSYEIVAAARASFYLYNTKEEIDLLVGRINGQFSKLNWTPIHYFYRSFPLPALSAFYRISDVALVSPMRDGMNLVCKEYVASRLDRKGVLILSEMAGASKELSDAIIINPHDIHQLVDAIYKALTLPVKLQIQSMTSMQKSLKRYNIHAWVKLFMDELANVKIEQSHLKTKLLDKQLSEEITYSYKQSDERLIFLDYDGTLVGFNENPGDSRPDQELKEILTLLTKDKKNHIVIISGRDRQSLQKWMKPFPLDIVAEHGVWIKRMDKPFKTSIKINSSCNDYKFSDI